MLQFLNSDFFIMIIGIFNVKDQFMTALDNQ